MAAPTVPSLYKAYGIQIGSTVIPYIQNWTPDPGLTEFLQKTDLAVGDWAMVGVDAQMANFTFQTQAISSALTACGVAGSQITSGSVLKTFFQRLLDGAWGGGTLVHTKLEVNAGFLYPVSLQAGLTPPATITYACAAKYDGTNAILKYTASQSLDGTMPTGGEAFSIGGMKLSAAGTVGGMQSLNVAFGIAPLVRRADGDVYPTFSGGLSRSPRMTITTENVDFLASYPGGLAIGTGQTNTTATFYLRKRGATGPLANDATSHISLTVNEGLIVPRAPVVNMDGEALASFDVICTSDGTNAPIVFATGAISYS